LRIRTDLSKMKILLVSLEYPPYSFGGVGSHVFNLSRRLAARNIECAVLSPGPSQQETEQDGVRHFMIPISGRAGLKLVSFALKIPRCVERVRERFEFDVLHSHFGPGAFLPPKLLRRVPLIETAHGTHLGELTALQPVGRLMPRELVGKYTVYPALALLDLLSYAKATRIVAVSELARQEVSRYGKRFLQKTVVVPNGIQLSDFPLRVAPPPRPHEDVRCLCVAFMQARKGLDYLIEAFDLLRQRAGGRRIKLTLVGDGPHFGRLNKFVEERGLSDNVRLTGRLNGSALRAAFEASHLFVLPSLWEGQGIVFLEAMAWGLPIVATRIPGVVGTLEHAANALLVPPKDSQALADAIQRLAETPELGRGLASEGLVRVRHFDWNQLVERIVSLYATALGGRV
jgi:phosphatidylinositol alpha-1,6-mannosyltransferase